MPKVSPLQGNFSGGEFSPLIRGRVDLDKYRTGLDVCKNYVPLLQGPLLRRPGTKFVGEVRDSAKRTRIIPFQFSTEQAYVLEFGHQHLRVYKDHGRVMADPDNIYDIGTPYTEDEIFDLDFVQSADVMYITHKGHSPYKLERFGHSMWQFSHMCALSFKDGPYLPINKTTTRLSRIQGAAGSLFFLFATDGVGAPVSMFQPTDIGRWVRTKGANGWAVGQITEFVSGSHVNGRLLADFAVVGGEDPQTVDWRLGLWSDTTGYPSTVAFHEDRLCFSGAPAAPQRTDGSATGDYENFQPDNDRNGTITAATAYALTINARNVNVVQWLASDEKGLVAGSAGGMWPLRPASAGEALSATNVKANRAVSYRSAKIQPLEVGRGVVFVQAKGRKLRELSFYYDVDGYHATDLTQLAEHITAGGLERDLAFTEEPFPIVWCIRADGVLLGMTYERDADALRVAWHRHTLGGPDAKVESLAVIPSPDGTRDELWLVVSRTIGGVTKRYVEYMDKFFEDTDDQADAYLVDCGLSYEGSPTSSVSGLEHLEGETVDIVADGADLGSKVVSGGAVALDVPAQKVHVGYAYPSDGKLLRIEAGAADGTALGKTRRTHRVGFLVHRTMGLMVGTSFDEMTHFLYRNTDDAMDEAVPLYSGIVADTLACDYDFENQVCWRQDRPLPGTILAVMPQMVTQDRG